VIAALEEESRTRALTGGWGGGRRDAQATLEQVEVQLLSRGASAWRAAEGGWRLEVPAGSWHAGRFSTPTLAELRPAASRPGSPRLSALVGAGALSDIGTLQALLGPGALFQVASQFNALEAPGPHGLAPVSRYPDDPTQGPRASVGAFAGTFLRHHRAPGPGGEVFEQGPGRQVELLEGVTGPGLATVTNGYLLRGNIADGEAFRHRLAEGFEALRVGLQEDVEVALGHGWGGPVPDPPPRIHQVFTSTIALGHYDAGPLRRAPDDVVEEVARQLLRGAYLGTLLAASRVGAGAVILTLIGGGVFGNSLAWIREAVLWACKEAERQGCGELDVWVNARELRPGWDGVQLAEDCRARGGALVEVDGDQVRVVGAERSGP
jgi:hypothetical protein